MKIAATSVPAPISFVLMKVMPRARDSTPVKAAGAMSSLAGGSLGRMGLDAFLHLCHRNILFVRGEMPDMSEGIDHCSDSITVEFILQSFFDGRAGADGLLED